MRVLMALGAVHGFLAVALGAFGAHGLKARLASLPDFSDRMGWWTTASQYQMAHALALLVVALAADRLGSIAALSGHLFSVGALLFSGSLYLMTLTGVRGLGAVTPLGGLCFLAGWGALLWGALRV